MSPNLLHTIFFQGITLTSLGGVLIFTAAGLGLVVLAFVAERLYDLASGKKLRYEATVKKVTVAPKS